jgi:hypothetical protein
MNVCGSLNFFICERYIGTFDVICVCVWLGSDGSQIEPWHVLFDLWELAIGISIDLRASAVIMKSSVIWDITPYSNICCLSTGYTALYIRSYNSSGLNCAWIPSISAASAYKLACRSAWFYINISAIMRAASSDVWTRQLSNCSETNMSGFCPDMCLSEQNSLNWVKLDIKEWRGVIIFSKWDSCVSLIAHSSLVQV